MKNYHISGSISNPYIKEIVLEKLDLITNERAFVSKTEVINGRFHIKDTINAWGLHSLVLHDSIRIPFFIESGEIKIQIPDSKEPQAEIEAGINNELLKKHKFTFTKKEGMELIKNHPHTVFSAFTTYYVLMNNNFEGDTIDQLVNLLSGEALESVYIPHIHKVAASIKKTQINQLAPDFSVKDSSDNPMKLSDFRGKYILLDFWTSWCKPCREANPKWKELYRKYKSESIEFLGVSFDVNCQPWKYALIKDQLPWPNGANCQGWDYISDLYGVKSVPQTFFIAPDGKILAKNVTPEQFESILLPYLSDSNVVN